MKHLLFMKALLTFFMSFDVWPSNIKCIDQNNEEINHPVMTSQSENERQNFENLISKTGQIMIFYQQSNMNQVQKIYDEIEDLAKRGRPGDEQALRYLLGLNSIVISERNNIKYDMVNDELINEILSRFKEFGNNSAISRYAYMLDISGYDKFANLFKKEILDD